MRYEPQFHRCITAHERDFYATMAPHYEEQARKHPRIHFLKSTAKTMRQILVTGQVITSEAYADEFLPA